MPFNCDAYMCDLNNSTVKKDRVWLSRPNIDFHWLSNSCIQNCRERNYDTKRR